MVTGSSNRPPIRHCPLCGVAMIAGKSDERLARHDRFTCLRCDTVIDFSGKPRDEPPKA